MSSICFYALIALNLSLVLKFGNFPTIDGAAHVYNGRIINTLIFDNNQVLKNFYSFNHTIEPNWSGHFLLALLMQVFKASIVKK